jgi:hypothetical protein
MSKVRVVYRPDKSVAVLYPAFKTKELDETEEQFLNRVFTKMMKESELAGLEYDDIDSSELPATREDRNAWEGEKGKKIKINNEKVKKDKDKKLVDNEMAKVLRQNTIDKLKTEGKLLQDYIE